MVRESNQNVFYIQIDASRFAEFEISEFEISRVDCTSVFVSFGLIGCPRVRVADTEETGRYPTLF